MCMCDPQGHAIWSRLECYTVSKDSKSLQLITSCFNNSRVDTKRHHLRVH